MVTLAHAVEERPRLSARLLRRLVNERRVPFYKSAGRIFDLGELDDWVGADRVELSISRTGGRRVNGQRCLRHVG
jgi:hypothetical protein